MVVEKDEDDMPTYGWDDERCNQPIQRACREAASSQILSTTHQHMYLCECSSVGCGRVLLDA